MSMAPSEIDTNLPLGAEGGPSLPPPPPFYEREEESVSSTGSAVSMPVFAPVPIGQTNATSTTEELVEDTSSQESPPVIANEDERSDLQTQPEHDMPPQQSPTESFEFTLDSADAPNPPTKRLSTTAPAPPAFTKVRDHNGKRRKTTLA